ncbi:Hypothetical protein R9X50_00644200 [Acrodontium crateriforme]|uniref:Uncharacterized protein n=1 Tax=Acrodontium crateriforme TaxID=150365 RepID=A0AAQ3R6T3_9PEZI|nr:Hypothetical protein R9X50_00644200 [Acrodontium crateriforme]
MSPPTDAQNAGLGSDLWITGLAAQYPPYLIGPEKLEKLAARFHDVESPGLRKVLGINRKTGIETRSSVQTFDDGFCAQKLPPSITEIDNFFRKAAVDLTAQACEKALKEWGGSKDDITHTIGVTCTNQGNPGYDLLVNRQLSLRSDVDRMLLHGVGCAGGLAIMRAAAQIASGATARGEPARILCFACELCSSNVRSELEAAEKSNPADVCVAAALFSDGAAAFVLCNTLGLNEETQPLFQLTNWGSALIPNTIDEMGFYAVQSGFRTILTKHVTTHTAAAVKPMFSKLLPSYAKSNSKTLTTEDFDWALHPGGRAIIDGVQYMMDLTEHQLRASRDIYRTRGNSSSPTVLIVLDKLRTMGRGSDHVVATAFGPGLTIEMALLKRCRDGPNTQRHELEITALEAESEQAELEFERRDSGNEDEVEMRNVSVKRKADDIALAMDCETKRMKLGSALLTKVA